MGVVAKLLARPRSKTRRRKRVRLIGRQFFAGRLPLIRLERQTKTVALNKVGQLAASNGAGVVASTSAYKVRHKINAGPFIVLLKASVLLRPVVGRIRLTLLRRRRLLASYQGFC